MIIYTWLYTGQLLLLNSSLGLGIYKVVEEFLKLYVK